ncbi:MAG: hypothetical protein F6K19_27215 [Cyanothece sp. SIO1E1]|nr:hypothetical protein [Cyanothece sp. SIO1E1]
MNDNVQARKAELDNLVKQKESREINQAAESTRLNQLEQAVSAESQHIEAVYQGFLASFG